MQARRLISLLMIATGLVLFATGSRSLYYRHVLLANHQPQSASYQIPTSQLPSHLTIGDVVNIPVEPAWPDENGVPSINQDVANFLASSARPKQNSNIIIYGHNTQGILGNLRYLQGNEVVTLTMQDGEQRWYEIKKMERVKTTQTEPLYPTDSEILTLYTCDGWADQDRFVVQAVPI